MLPKMTDAQPDPTRQKWIDAGLEDSYQELLDRDGISKSNRTKEQLREVFTETFEGYLSVAFYEAVQHDVSEKDWGRTMVEHSAKVLADDAIDILFPDDVEEES